MKEWKKLNLKPKIERNLEGREKKTLLAGKQLLKNPSFSSWTLGFRISRKYLQIVEEK